MGKATYLADLYQKSVEILTQNRTEWMGLLSSVSKYYKLSFDKNVLIYVQRPDAGLLATKMGWEKQTGRYLKAGCKGIGVVDMDNPKATLTYYFDLADTRGSYDGFRAAMNAVLELERQYQPEIMHRFHIQFRTDTTSIENCLCQLVQMQGKAYMAKYNPTVSLCGICNDKPYDDQKTEKLNNNVMKLNEHNGVILACKQHPLLGYVLSTYKQDTQNNNRPIQRQYFYNKEEAFESFAVRSGLVDEKKLFTESELKILYDGLIKVSTQDESLSQDQLEEVGKLVNRMEELLPELHKEEKRFDMSKLLDAISFGNMGNGMER